jgi:hypothetical protein
MLQGKAFGATSTELGNCWRVEGIFWIGVLELVVLWIWLNIPFFILDFWGCCVERLIGGFKDSTPSSSVDFGPVVYPIDPDWTEDFRLCRIFQISGVLECIEFVKRTCE